METRSLRYTSSGDSQRKETMLNFLPNALFTALDVYKRQVKANVYEEAYNLSKDKSAFAWNGQWHSGPISTIQTLGYIVISLYLILSVVGMTYAWIVSRIYRNHQYKLGILYVSAVYFLSLIHIFQRCGGTHQGLTNPPGRRHGGESHQSP